MANVVTASSLPFLFTYWNPFSRNSNLVENWFEYVKNVSLAKYAADSVGRYIKEASSDQIRAIDTVGEKICGCLYAGFSTLENQLSLIGGELQDISHALQNVNQRLDLLLDEVKTSNLLQENIAELLRIPDSQKQRQHHIEMGLRFLKNALKDEDLYQDALKELLEAEKLMPYDYFVLHRIGMIYLHVPAAGNIENALAYFARAGKYAAVESDPNAARLSNVLNKQVRAQFRTQADPTASVIGALAAESYLQAGMSLYALARFDEAAKMVEKAIKYAPGEPRHRFFFAKYLTRSGSPDAAVEQLKKAIEIVPVMALAAIADFDLNKAAPILDLLARLDTEITEQSRQNISALSDWPQGGYQRQEVQRFVEDAQNCLAKGNYAEKATCLTKLTEWLVLMPFATELAKIAAHGIGFNAAEAARLLQGKSPERAEKAWVERLFKGFRLFPELYKIAAKTNPTFSEQVLLATANGEFRPYSDEDEDVIQQCIEVVRTERNASDSLIQRRLRLDCTRAARIMDELENRGIVGPSKGDEPRDILNKRAPGWPTIDLNVIDEDEEVIQKCIEVIRGEKTASISLIQRRLRLGYGRTARIMDELENRGIVGPSKGAEPRDILIDLDVGTEARPFTLFQTLRMCHFSNTAKAAFPTVAIAKARNTPTIPIEPDELITEDEDDD